MYLGQRPTAGDIDLREIAFETQRFSGAALANLVNVASILAGRAGREEVCHSDILGVSVLSLLMDAWTNCSVFMFPFCDISFEDLTGPCIQLLDPCDHRHLIKSDLDLNANHIVIGDTNDLPFMKLPFVWLRPCCQPSSL